MEHRPLGAGAAPQEVRPMDSIQVYKEKLEKLDSMLKHINSNQGRLMQLKRCVSVLLIILNDQAMIHNPYGPRTPIIMFSVQ